MSGFRSTLADYGKRRIAFTILVLATLALFLVQSWENHVFLLAGWFDNGLGILTDGEHHLLHIGHRLHNLAISLMTLPFLVGMVAQLRSPTRHVTGMLMAVSVWLVGVVAIGLTGVVPLLIIAVVMGVPTVVAAVLHPTGRQLFTSFDVSRISRPLLVLVVLAAIPLMAFAAHETGLQTGAIEAADHAHAGGEHAEIHEEHVGGGHYARMVWLAFSIIATGLLASFRQPGWRLGAWTVSLMTIVFGVSGLLAPEAASNPGLLWNLLAIVWGVGVVAATRLTRSTDQASPYGARDPDTTP